MTRRLATKLGLATLWSLVTTALVVDVVTTASDVDEDPAADADIDWGCAAAAAEFQYFGDNSNVPMTLVEGELRFIVPLSVSRAVCSRCC